MDRKTPCFCSIVGLIIIGFLSETLPLGATPPMQDQLQQYRKNLQNGQSDLSTIQEKITDGKKQLLISKTQERSLLFELQGMEQRQEDAEERYQDIQTNLETVHAQLNTLQSTVKQTQESSNVLKGLLSRRLRVMYEETQFGFLHLWLSSPSLAEAMLRVRFLHTLAAQNTFWLERLQQHMQQLHMQRRQLAAREDHARQLELQAQLTLSRIEREKKERSQLLEKIRHQRSSQERAVQELEQASKRLTALITRLKAKTTLLEKRMRRVESSEDPMRAFQGSLPWPTRGLVISRFGKVKHARFNTYLYNKGIDIAGSIGQNVQSVAPGTVIFADWFEGFGRMVILDHGYGYNTIYAHLQRIVVSEGQTIAENQVVGQLGDSGTWKGPSLYFEIRYRGQALDPTDWLSR
jgi:murein hydrolase activator